MSTAPSRGLAQENEPNGGPSGEYTRLRELLVGPEQARLEELQRRLDDRQLRTEELSQVVAEAIAVRSRRDRALQQSLNPLVEEAVRISVTRDPNILANALFPVIGEAVRKAVAHALRGLVESINQTLERSVSLEAFVLARTLERVHAEYGPLLASFNGDGSAFAAARPLLDSCLLGRQVQKSAKQSKPFFIVSAAALLVALALVTFFSTRTQRRWDHLVERLRQEPGIMLTGADRSWGTYELVGLRDPLSTDPEKIVRASGIDPAKVTSRWEPYVSLDAKFKVFRQFLAEKDALEQAVLRFPLNSVQLSAEQLAKLDDIEAHIVKLQQDGGAIGQKFVVELHGHTDPSGNEDKNDTLSQRRADEVVKSLVSRGISKDMLRTVAMGSREPVRAAAAYLTELNRRVTFHVVTENEAGR